MATSDSAAVTPLPTATVPAGVARKKSRRNLILLIVAIVVGALALTIYLIRRGHESTDDAQIDADVVLVPARVEGIVKKVNFVENQRVKAGDVLAEVDDATLVAKLAQAEASIAQATAQADAADASAAIAERTAVGNQSATKAAVTGATIGATTSAQQLEEGRAQLAASEAQLAQNQKDVDRERALVATGAVGRESLEQQETQLRVATSNRDLAKARLATLQSSVGAARSRVDEASARAAQSSDVTSTVKQARAQADAAKAQVKVAIAMRDLAALDLSHTKIIAPQDGVISKKAINVGQAVGAGQAVGQLVTDARWVTANFKETQIGDMKPGQPVKISVDAFSGLDLEGVVESISSGTGARFTLLPPDNASGNFTKVVQRVPVRIRLVNLPKDVVLRTGMNVDANVDVREK